MIGTGAPHDSDGVGAKRAVGSARQRAATYRRRRRTVGAVVLALAVGFAIAGWQLAMPAPRPALPAQAVVGVSPRPGRVVLPDATLEVRLAQPPGASLSAVLSPPVAGTWGRCAPRAVCFAASTYFSPGVRETLTVTFGSSRMPTTSPARRAFVAHFSVAPASVGLAQVLLAQLGYLPLTHSPTRVSGRGRRRRAASDRAADSDPAASLVWRYADIPSALRAHWDPGDAGVLTDGALVQFERVQDIESGTWPLYATALTPTVWSALLTAAVARRTDPDPYAIAIVHESRPEHLDIWQDGHVVLDTLVNTGIPGGATPRGTFYVYQRYRSQTMRGITTTGKPYLYSDVPDVDYFQGNIAIHGFARASYGFPQSQGCVEVPLEVAESVYARLHYGSVVVVLPA